MSKTITFSSFVPNTATINFNFSLDGGATRYPIVITFSGTGIGANATNPAIRNLTIGNNRVAEYTLKNLHTALGAITGTNLAATFKDLVLDAITENISV